MSSLAEPITKRIGKLVRMMSSDFDGEMQAATRRLKALLHTESLSFHDLAIMIENHEGEIEERKYSDSEAKAIFERGIEKGREQHNGRSLSPDYFDDDGGPRWLEIAKFCQGHQAALNPKEQEFVDEMPGKLHWRAPSRGQGGFLLSIFWKTRGTLR